MSKYEPLWKYLKENNNKLFLKEYCKDDLTTYNVLDLIKNNESKINFYIRNANIIILNMIQLNYHQRWFRRLGI